jgi:hypothetical protein
MKSIEATVRDWDPQPLARVPLASFQRWKQSLIEHINLLETTRSAHHPLGVRLKNMLTFIEDQCAAIARVEGSIVTIQAGKFFWFLVRLQQRQESMKTLIASDDPFIHQIDPALRRRIMKGWDLLTNVSSKFWSRVKALQRKARGVAGP